MTERIQRRHKSNDFELAGRKLLTLESFAEKIHRPTNVVRAWSNRVDNPLPVIVPPSGHSYRKPQVQYVDEGIGLAWLLGFEKQPTPPSSKKTER